MGDWYRRKTWTKTDEKEFFSKLGRARKDGRAQYLRIQAIELIETNNSELLKIAETLLIKILIEYPDNQTEKSRTFNSLGEICKSREEYNKALEYFKMSLNYEKEFPNIITAAYLNYSETVIQTERTELYDEVEKLLTKEINKDTLKFPVQNYIIYSILSIISNLKGDFEKAKTLARIAEENATTKTNNLWNPKKKNWGIVKERIDWLDKLVKK